MSDSSIARDEILLRRVPDRPDQTKQIGSHRGATSFAIRPRKGELGPSFSLASITSPKQLLSYLEPHQNPDEWLVCALRVEAIWEIGWAVVVTPDRACKDPGHCEIRPGAEISFSRELWKKLSQHTRILTPEQIKSVETGESIEL